MGNTSALLPWGWGQPAPSSLTTHDEVGTIYPSASLFFLGETEAQCGVWGLLTTSRGTSAGMFPIQLRRRTLRKNLHVSFGHGIVSTKCKSCFASGVSLCTSRDRGITLTLTPLSFCIHPSYSKYLCALQPCQRFHPHPIHFTQDFFPFSLRRGGGGRF